MGRAFEYRRAAKEKRWGKMSKVFPKLGRAITVAAKAGGDDPEMNSALRTAIQNAKAENMPKDNIEAAIKRASGKDAKNYDEVNYEGKGPHGVLIFVETATDNTTRTVANIKDYFKKAKGQVVPTGSLEFMFTRKAVIEFELAEGMDAEELEMELIDAGLDELEVEENSAIAYAAYTEFGALNGALEGLGVNIVKATLERFANDEQTFTAEQMEDIDKLIDKIEDDEDVQAVYTNIAH